jgi:predicted nucleotidyltransferase
MIEITQQSHKTDNWVFRFDDIDKTLLKSLNQHRVDCIIIGGVATAYYGCRPLSEINDLDFLIRPSLQSARRFHDALKTAEKSLNLPSTNFDVSNLPSAPNVQFKFIGWPYEIDFITYSSVPEFDLLFEQSIEVDIGLEKVRVISLIDLIEMKRMAITNHYNVNKKHRIDLSRLIKLQNS